MEDKKYNKDTCEQKVEVNKKNIQKNENNNNQNIQNKKKKDEIDKITIILLLKWKRMYMGYIHHEIERRVE